MDTIERQDFAFKTQPYKHQQKAFARSRDEKDFALLMEPGTGKSKILIDTAAWLFMKGKIRLLAVIAPNGVHRNWIDREVPAHFVDWIPYRAVTWSSAMKSADRKLMDGLWDADYTGMRIVAMNVEAFGTESGKAKVLLKQLLNAFPTLLTVDESTRIKTPGATRTKVIVNLAKYAGYRRIATGTPVTNGPLDLYAQFKFLGEKHLGFSNFYSFKHRYAEWEQEKNWRTGRTYETLVGYRNLDELIANVNAVSFRVTKRECLDLPPKIYQRRTLNMSEAQARLYNQLRKKIVVELDTGGEMTVKNMLTRLMRLQQVLGGFAKSDDGEVVPLFDKPHLNPRLQELLYVVNETSGKCIIWSRFVDEIKLIAAALRKEYGDARVVEYYGDVKSDDRQLAVDRFQGVWRDDAKVEHPLPDEQHARFFVGQPHSGGIGLTLTEADTVIYYSNDFSLETRLQSEDRAHRIGLKHPVTYVDLECEDTVDSHIIAALLKKDDVANLINQDAMREWLRSALKSE